jgi:hypothetical protein
MKEALKPAETLLIVASDGSRRSRVLDCRFDSGHWFDGADQDGHGDSVVRL